MSFLDSEVAAMFQRYVESDDQGRRAMRDEVARRRERELIRTMGRSDAVRERTAKIAARLDQR